MVMVMVAALGKVVTLCATALPPTPPLVCPGHLQQGTERWSLGSSSLMLILPTILHGGLVGGRW